MRLRKLTIITLLVVLTGLTATYNPVARQAHGQADLRLTATDAPPAPQANEQEGWQVNSSFGFPAWVALHKKDGHDILGIRILFIYLEAPYFTPENVRKLFTELAAQYPNPEWLQVTAFSDREMLRRAMDARDEGCRVKGWENTPEGKAWAATYRPLPTGYYRAKYFRIGRDNYGQHYLEENYSYSPDPDKEDVVTVVLQDKSSPDNRDLNDALLHAAATGNAEKVKMLLALGADANTRNKVGDTVLLIATISATDDGMVKALLEAGADANAENNDFFHDSPKQLALTYAAAHKGPEILAALLDGGAEVNARNGNRRSALLMAAANGRAENVKMLLARGAETELQDEEGKTALLWAAERGHSEVVEALLAHGAPVDVKGSHGSTPLMLARDKQSVMALLKYGADVNAQNDYGETALTYAVESLLVEKVQVLIAAGANVNMSNKAGDMPLRIARKLYRSEKLIQLLKDAGAKE